MRSRSLLLLPLLLVAAVVLLSAPDPAAQARGRRTAPDGQPVTVPRDPHGPGLFGPLQRGWTLIEPEPLAAPPVTLSAPDAVAAPLDHAADFCSTAPSLSLNDGTGGDFTFVNEASVEPDDPNLSACMWGNPPNPRGHRTVWYHFTAPFSGRVTIFTDFNPSDYSDSYDTVLALYRSTVGGPAEACDNLQLVSCNDDASGFLSQISTFVTQGETYYIEVADWHFPVEGAATLRLSIVLEEGESVWERDVDDYLPDVRSRHMVVSDDRYFYIIGGERVIDPFPQRDDTIWRFNPRTGEYDTLHPFPAPSFPGYSRTSAAHLAGRIYTPSGFVGDVNQYDGDHWVYDIAANEWFQTTPVPWNQMSPTGLPYAWAEAVASPDTNSYYLTGGLLSGDPDPAFPTDARPTGQLLRFRPSSTDPQSGFWQDLTDMPTPRYGHVAALLQTPFGRRVCVAGGVGNVGSVQPNQAEILMSTECYNVVLGSWDTVAPLNFPRFAAGSAVGPDGRWYVFGGVNARLEPVTITEVYHPATNTWEVLDSRYSLRRPGRFWPRGAFLDSELWVFGGETVDNDALLLVQSLFVPTHEQLFPIIRTTEGGQPEPNDTLAEAHPIPLQAYVSGDFADQEDFFDVYSFQVNTSTAIRATVSSIPPDHDYNIYLYNANKDRVDFSRSVGNQLEVLETLPVPPGTYYVMIIRVFGEPTSDTYQVFVEPIE